MSEAIERLEREVCDASHQGWLEKPPPSQSVRER